METLIRYVLVFQLLCGALAAFVARRKGRSGLFWLLAGTCLPVIGVVLALASKAGGKRGRAKRPVGESRPQKKKRPPKRCCGRYIPDCEGCPFFQRLLFDEQPVDGRKGKCRRYNRDLKVNTDRKRNRVIMEEEEQEE